MVFDTPVCHSIPTFPFLQDIKFQTGLDMFEFCAPELQERLLVTRQYFKEEDDKKAVRYYSHYLCYIVVLGTTTEESRVFFHL